MLLISFFVEHAVQYTDDARVVPRPPADRTMTDLLVH